MTPNMNHPVRQLSGGNIQKVLLGRELDANPHLLITAYPVRGLDINTCYTIYDLLLQEKAKGVGVLMIAEDLDVLLEISDRIMVMYNGTASVLLDARKCNKEMLGLIMTGNNVSELEEAK